MTERDLEAENDERSGRLSEALADEELDRHSYEVECECGSCGQTRTFDFDDRTEEVWGGSMEPCSCGAPVGQWCEL